MATFAKGSTLLKMFSTPLSKGVYSKSKQFAPHECAEKQTVSLKVTSLCMLENLLIVSHSLKYGIHIPTIYKQIKYSTGFK